MREIIIELNDGRHFVVEAEGKEVAWIAAQGAAQTDEHREGLWTLKTTEGRVVPPHDSVDRHFKHGHHAALYLVEKHARVTPIGSTHPDDRTPPTLPDAPSQHEAPGAAALDDDTQQRRIESITRSAAKSGRTLATKRSTKRSRKR